MSYQYLDPNGLTTLWGIIKNRFGQIDGIFLGGSGTTAGITNKMATINTFGPASAGAAGSVGLVPAPGSGKQNTFLRGDGEWAAPVGSTYAAGTYLTLSGTTFNHDNSGVIAGSKGDTTAQTPGFGGTFKALSGTVDAQGHLTAFAEHNVTIPNSVATSETDGLMSYDDKNRVDSTITELQLQTDDIILRGSSNNGTIRIGFDIPTTVVDYDDGSSQVSFDDWKALISFGTATTAEKGVMSAEDKTKLNGIAAGAEVNQNAFSNIKVGSSTVAADSKTDTLTLVSSGSISLSANTSTDTVTITGTDTTYAVATSNSDGLMSAADKQTLDNIVTTGGEPNQDAFSYVIVSGSTVAADDKKDKLTLVGSGSVSLSATTGTDTITITGTNTTYAASTSSPLMDGTAAVGTSTSYARGDHRHPTDTSRAPLASPQFTGTPGAPTAAAGTASTQIATTAFVNTAITNALADITGIEYEVVQSLPATGEAGVIYLISNSGSAPNIYDEYIWTGTAFEKIGTTDVDLSGYVQDTDLVAITTAEIEAICV